MTMEINKKEKRHFDYARRISLKSDFERTPFGVVVLYKGRVVGTGYNSHKTNPVQKRYDQFRTFRYNNGSYIKHSIHAEVDALYPLIDRDDINWDKVQVYIYRRCKSREHGMARPCPACMNLIKELGIKNIYYTTDDGFAHELVG